MSYRAPVRDLALSLQIAGHPALVSGAFAELDDDTVAAVLEAAGAFTEEQLAPLNRKGDQVGARYENGAVIAAPGFADAYQAFVAGVVQRLLKEQNAVSWTPEAVAEEAEYERWTKFGYAGLAAGTAALLALGYFTWKGTS